MFVADFIGDTNFLTAIATANGSNGVSLRLSSGQVIDASSDRVRDGQVTLAVRPEHARLSAPADGLLTGTLSDVIYFGTDTHYHIALDDGTAFVLRQQNGPDAEASFAQGDKVGVTFLPAMAQVLKD